MSFILKGLAPRKTINLGDTNYTSEIRVLNFSPQKIEEVKFLVNQEIEIKFEVNCE